MNRYLDRKMRRDGRNPYGSRGGYVTTHRGRRDRRSMSMDYREYADRPYGKGAVDREYGLPYNAMQQPREYNRGMEFYGYGAMQPMNSYDGGYQPYYDYGSGKDEEYKEDLKDWAKKLKKFDKFNVSKDELINQARNMGLKFQDYDEEEFITTYYMLMSDYKLDMLNSPQAYIIMARDFLEDEDSELKGGEKLCTYMYEIVMGEALD